MMMEAGASAPTRTGFRLREAAGRGNIDEVLKQLSGAEACDVDDSGDVSHKSSPLPNAACSAWLPRLRRPNATHNNWPD